MLSGIWAGGISFLVVAALVPLLVRFATGRGLLDVPNERSSHDAPTPRLGGLAILLGAWAGTLAVLPQEGVALLVTATLMGLVGLADDLRGGLHFGVKAALQSGLAIVFVALFPPALLEGMPMALAAVFLVAGVVWVVALTNAFNFMDGIDGLMGGVALVSLVFLAPLAGGGSLLAAVGGATAGFLVWNTSPAGIFLGDAGSYFLGFLLATIALYAPASGGPWMYAACVAVFTPLLTDTGYTLIRRWRAGVNVFAAHREHVYQRITPTSALHRRTSNLYYGLSVLAGLSALLLSRGWPLSAGGMALAGVCCAGVLALPYLISEKR